jgi:WD40 repeat protein
MTYRVTPSLLLAFLSGAAVYCALPTPNVGPDLRAEQSRGQQPWKFTAGSGAQIAPGVKQGGIFQAVKTKNAVTKLAFSPDGKTLAVGEAENSVTLFNAKDGKVLASLKPGGRLVRLLAFSADGKSLVTGLEITTAATEPVKMWNVADGKEKFSVTAGKGSIQTGDFALDDKYIAIGTNTGAIVVWDVTTKQIHKTIEAHKGSIITLAFSVQGKMLASSSGVDKKIQVWDVATGENRATFMEPISPSFCLAFASDDKKVLAGGFRIEAPKGVVRFWDIMTKNENPPLAAHSTKIDFLALTENGKILATGCMNEKTVKLWNLATRKELASIQVFALINAMALSRDGKLLAISSVDRHIRLFDLAVGAG